MRARIAPGGRLSGEAWVPGDKSIAHRWLILAATAAGRSVLRNPPASLDVLATARCLAQVCPDARPGLDVWAGNGAPVVEPGGSTWNGDPEEGSRWTLEVQGEGRSGLREPVGRLDCANSGTTMRLLTGLLAAHPFRAELVGDPSLSRRPMERVADPLRRMGASVSTSDGHPPVTVRGGSLQGIEHRAEVPSAQVKTAVLLAGLAAEGTTAVVETARTRDHTERALLALGAPIEIGTDRVAVRRFQHPAFDGTVPGDVSSAAYLVAAAVLTGSPIAMDGVGLNPTRSHFLDVLHRMGVDVQTKIQGEELGEPIGELRVGQAGTIHPVVVEPEELPLIVDELPVLAALAAHASGPSRFLGAAELRLKESDRLEAIAGGLRGLGGRAGTRGDELVVSGGGLEGGTASSRGDHRIAMSLVVASLGAAGPSVIEDVEAADVSFPGFLGTLGRMGVAVEPI